MKSIPGLHKSLKIPALLWSGEEREEIIIFRTENQKGLLQIVEKEYLVCRDGTVKKCRMTVHISALLVFRSMLL